MGMTPMRFSIGSLAAGESKPVLGLSTLIGIQPPSGVTLELARIDLWGNIDSAEEEVQLTASLWQKVDDVDTERCVCACSAEVAEPVHNEEVAGPSIDTGIGAPWYVEVSLGGTTAAASDIGGVLWFNLIE